MNLKICKNLKDHNRVVSKQEIIDGIKKEIPISKDRIFKAIISPEIMLGF